MSFWIGVVESVKKLMGSVLEAARMITSLTGRPGMSMYISLDLPFPVNPAMAGCSRDTSPVKRARNTVGGMHESSVHVYSIVEKFQRDKTLKTRRRANSKK
jgi:hypothetical protein